MRSMILSKYQYHTFKIRYDRVRNYIYIMDLPAGMLRLHPFSEEKTWVEADFMQQLKAEMLEAAEEVGLPGGRWLVDGKPPQSVTVSTSGPSAPPASTQRPSDQQLASPPKRLRAAQKGLSTGCSEKMHETGRGVK